MYTPRRIRKERRGKERKETTIRKNAHLEDFITKDILILGKESDYYEDKEGILH